MPNYPTDCQNRAVEEPESIRLSLADQQRFGHALIDPPALAPAMERAFERHRRLVGPLPLTPRRQPSA